MEAGMRGEPLALHGCAPTPLASYLKALGVLRLVSSPANHVAGEAADPHARGWWENECFHVRTTLNRDALLHFFLHDYAPSPIIAPWNGRAGFLEGHDEDTTGSASIRPKAQRIGDIETSTTARLENIRMAISSLRASTQLSEYRSLRIDRKKAEKEVKILTGDSRQRKQELKKDLAKQEKTAKEMLLPTLRSTSDPRQLLYVDTCYILSSIGKPTAAPLLIGGGVDGSRDFGSDFIQSLEGAFDIATGKPTAVSCAAVGTALFSENTALDGYGSLGLFTPLQSGLKSTTGLEVGGDKDIYPLNAWDVVLAMEGTLLFAGALTRCWEVTGVSRAAFPFTFEPTGAGTGSLSVEDPNRPRGEVWTPIWCKPATFVETAAIFAEGRLTLGECTARTGLDAARAVARVGAARGIESFERYSIIQPDSKMPYQATPLGRFKAPDRPRRDLVSDLEAGDWLSRARRLVGNKKTAPARARQAMRRLEDALFQMTIANRESEGNRSAVMALGGLVGWLASNPAARRDLRPPPLISSDWIREADDGSAEFRIAAALACLGLPALARPARSLSAQYTKAVRPNGNVPADGSPTERKMPAVEEQAGGPGQGRSNAAPPMAVHFAPLDEQTFFYRGTLGTRRAWAPGGDTPPTMIWGAGPLVPNLIAVLERRLLEASTRGLDDKALAGAAVARLADVAAFLSADFDDVRCATLLAGLVWARPARLRAASRQPASAPLPFAYAVLKPLFTPDAALRAVGALPAAARMPVPPRLISRLRAGGNSRDGRATDAAVRLALARARASGLPTLFGRRAGARESIEGGCMGAGVPADRLAAALLIPIGDRDSAVLIERAYPGALNDDDSVMTEDTTHAA